MLCGKKNKNNRKALGPIDLNIKILAQKYRFSAKEFEEYKKEFENLCSGQNFFTLEKFCEKMGPLGLEPTRLISDRIFIVMNKSKSGQVSMQEYLEYMDILMHGTRYEKVLQSYKLITQDNSKTICYSQFESWMIKVWKMLNILTGAQVSATKENVSALFTKLDKKGDGHIDFEEFESALSGNNGISEWFDIVNKQISENLNVSGKFKAEDFVFNDIENEIVNCIGLLKGQGVKNHESFDADPEILLESSHLTRPKGDFDSFLALNHSSFNQDPVSTVILKLSKILNTLQESKASFSTKPKLHYPLPTKNLIRWCDNDWTLIMNMMIGIQRSINSTSCDINSDYSSSEFIFKSKLQLPGKNNKLNFHFTDYAPNIFYRLRNHFDVTSNEYIQSLGVEKIVSSLMNNEFSSLSGQCSSGKSGSFFFYSADGRYLLKTITINEYSLLRKILPDYFFHMLRNPSSYLTKFYGLYKIVGNNTVYFVVMGNTFCTDLEINRKFDLKGSTYGRTTNPNADWSVARKDLDFKESIRVGHKAKKRILEQIEADVELLERVKVIDYSLLLGISENREGKEVDEWGVLSVGSKEVYYFGIIDFLTKFGAKKKLEHFVMGTLHGKTQVSCIPPKKYSKRFLNYLTKIFE